MDGNPTMVSPMSGHACMHCLRGRSAKGVFSAAGTLGPIPLGNLFNLVADTAKPAYTCHSATRPHARLVRANPGEVYGSFRAITTEYELAPNTSLSSVTGYPGNQEQAIESLLQRACRTPESTSTGSATLLPLGTPKTVEWSVLHFGETKYRFAGCNWLWTSLR